MLRSKLRRWTARCRSNPMIRETKATRALVVSLDWKADTRPLHQMIDEIRSKIPSGNQERCRRVVYLRFSRTRWSSGRNACSYRAGRRVVNGDNSTQFNSPALWPGLLGRMLKDENKSARRLPSALRPEQEKIVQAQPDYGPAVCTLALIDAGLGRKEEALRVDPACGRTDACGEGFPEREPT